MREHITPDTIANNARMRRTIDHRVVVLVEGVTDALLLESLLDTESCVVQFGNDRDTAVAALRILNGSQFGGCIAIIDADFHRLSGSLEPEDNCFHSDGHDLEIMLLTSQALDRVVGERGSREKIEAFAQSHGPVIASAILRLAEAIGKLRFVSFRDELNLRFKGMRFSRFVDRSCGAISSSDLLTEVIRRTEGHVDRAGIESSLIETAFGPFDSRDLCNGHDCIEILGQLLQRLLGSNQSGTVTKSVLERELRLAYTTADFHRTKLYRALIEWQQCEGLPTLFADE